jgi:hypothetical protein
MEFHSTDDVKRRLGGLERLTPGQWEEIVTHVRFLLPDALPRYFAELLSMLARDLVSVQDALDHNQSAIEKFDASAQLSLNEVRSALQRFDTASGKLSATIYRLTWGMLILTLCCSCSLHSWLC